MAARRNLTKPALTVAAVGALSVGLPALLAPKAFYEDFPWLASWVDRLPPYNEHLVTDVGGLYLAFGLLLGWAARRPSRELVVPVSLAFAVSALAHLAYHLTALDGFSAADAAAQTASLLVLAVAPLVAAAEVRRRPEPRNVSA